MPLALYDTEVLFDDQDKHCDLPEYGCKPGGGVPLALYDTEVLLDDQDEHLKQLELPDLSADSLPITRAWRIGVQNS